MRNDGEFAPWLKTCVKAAAALAHSVPDHQPPAALKQRILRDIAVGKDRRLTNGRDAGSSVVATLGDRRDADDLLRLSGSRPRPDCIAS